MLRMKVHIGLRTILSISRHDHHWACKQGTQINIVRRKSSRVKGVVLLPNAVGEIRQRNLLSGGIKRSIVQRIIAETRLHWLIHIEHIDLIIPSPWIERG
jgi:hypothetical protein